MGKQRTCVQGLPNIAGTFLPWEVSAVPSGCMWNADLWEFPSASLNSGRTDPKLYHVFLHLCPDSLLFQGVPLPYFLFLSFSYLGSSAPANHTLHTAKPSQQIQPTLQGRSCCCPVAGTQQDLHERLLTTGCFQLRRAATERWLSRRQGEGHTPLFPVLLEERGLAQWRPGTISRHACISLLGR